MGRRKPEIAGSKQSNSEAKTEDGLREPTDAERLAISKAKQARESLPARPAYREEACEDSGTMTVASPHSDKEGHPYFVADTFATTSDDFINHAIVQLANMTLKGEEPNLEGLNSALAMVGAIDPQNELEAALAVQMVSTHELTNEMMRRAKLSKTVEGMRQYSNEANKLTRSFTAQLKALADWRRGGEQVVRHVHVYQGGQAIVADTINTGGQNSGSPTNNVHEQYSEGTCGPAMLGYDPAWDQMPTPCNEREEALQPTRRKNRRRRSPAG